MSKWPGKIIESLYALPRRDIGTLEYSKDGILLDNSQTYKGIVYKLHRNGELAEEFFCAEGVREGVIRQWYSNGRLSSISQVLHSKRNGVTIEWHQGGTIKSSSFYKLDSCMSRQQWDQNGNV